MTAKLFLPDDEPDVASCIEMLTAGLTHDDPVSVLTTALLLAELGGEAGSAVPLLIEALQRSSSYEVRWAAALALGRIGPPARSAIPHLMRALHDAEEDVQYEARVAIERVLG